MSHPLASYWPSNSEVDYPSTRGSVNTTVGYLGEKQEEPLKSLPQKAYKPPSIGVSLVVSGINRPSYTLR